MKTPRNFDDYEFEIPANDNGHRAPDPTLRRVPSHVGRGGNTDVLLALAGFDPDKIPRKLHAPALRAVWCFEQGLYAREAVCRASNLSGKTLARTLAALRAAAKPGVNVA